MSNVLDLQVENFSKSEVFDLQVYFSGTALGLFADHQLGNAVGVQIHGVIDVVILGLGTIIFFSNLDIYD